MINPIVISLKKSPAPTPKTAMIAPPTLGQLSDTRVNIKKIAAGIRYISGLYHAPHQPS
jgi:hypothetical protein